MIRNLATHIALPCIHLQSPHPKGDTITVPCIHKTVKHPKGHKTSFGIWIPCTHLKTKHPKGHPKKVLCTHKPVPKHPKGDKKQINFETGYKFPFPIYVGLESVPSLWQTILNDRLKPNNTRDIIKNIYYVNGVRQTLKSAETNRKNLLNHINGSSNVKLIYNPTGIDGIANTKNAVIDFEESLEDKIWFPPQPIINPTTIAVISLLYAGMAKNCPIGLVGYSQGSIIIANAILAFSKFNQKNMKYLKKNVKVCFVGVATLALTGKILNLLVKRYLDIGNTKDIVAQLVGVRALSNREVRNLDTTFEAHKFHNYLPLKGADIFPSDFFTNNSRINIHKTITV